MPGENDLKTRLEQWLGAQGSPLEFTAAATFANAGFRVMQGYHVEGAEDEPPREIDVLVQINVQEDDALVRVEFVVECKWSNDKPWVVFVSRRGIAPSACAAQTMGSSAGRAILWARCGDKALHRLGLFSTPEMPGFGGRQAFSTGRDVFFESLNSVTSAAYAMATGYDRPFRSPVEHLKLAAIVIPVIVVKGRLFEGRFNEASARLMLDERRSSRLHWRGSDKWHLHTTVDVVTENELPRFVNARRDEAIHAARVIMDAL